MPADRRRPRDVYLEAATGAHGWRQVDLQRRAAEQFLIGGHIDRGPGRHPHGPPRPAHAAGAEPAGGARLAGLAARPDPLARTRVRRARPGSRFRRTICCASIPAGR